MNTLSSDEMNWIEQQLTQDTAVLLGNHLTERPRLVLAEVGAHTGARMCGTMQELAGTKEAIKLGRHRQPTGPFHSQTTARENTGTIERPRHFWFSLRCGSYCTPATAKARPGGVQVLGVERQA